MAIRANLTATVGALLVGLFLLISGFSPAYAHGGHDHGSKQPAAAQGGSVNTAAIEAFHATDDRVNGPPADGSQRIQAMSAGVDLARDAETPLSLCLERCCCGSSACHTGVTVPSTNVFPEYRIGQRMRPPLVLGTARAVQTGSDRPPRQRTAA